MAAEPVELGVETAIPLGLVIDARVSNAYQHGFAGGATGELHVALGILADNRLRLWVGDSGRGLPADFDIARTRSLGMRLVRTPADRLVGELSVVSPGGAGFELVFFAPTSPFREPRNADEEAT